MVKIQIAYNTDYIQKYNKKAALDVDRTRAIISLRLKYSTTKAVPKKIQ